MDLNYSADDQAFRARARAWLAENLPETPRPPEGQAAADWDRAWQAKLAAGGFAGLSWPAEFGGAGLDGVKQVIWFEELGRVNGPHQGAMGIAMNHAGPTLILRGTDEQKAFHLPKIMKGEVICARASPSPVPVRTSPRCPPRASSTAITSSSTGRRCGPPTPTTRLTRNC
jgi:alkylation response protein AidB-like acyl-CoA dehydrogenase